MTDRPRRAPGRSGAAAALVAANLIAVGIIAFTWVLSARYYATRLPPGDMGSNLSIVLRAGELADVAGFREAFAFAADEGVYVLHSLVSVLLHPLLPKSFAMGPILNAIWYLVAINVLFRLFLRESHSPVAAALLTLPPVLFMPAMSTPRFGFTGLDVNLLAYLLACSIFASVILSERLTDRRWAALAGGLFGCLVLGRLQSSVIVAIAIAPLLLSALVPRQTRRWAAVGLAVFAGAALLVCGGWIVPGLYKHWAFYRDIASAPGQSFEASYFEGLRIWARTLDVWFRSNLATALCWLLLSWVTAREILTAERSVTLLSRLEWGRLWMFAGPMLALALTRAGQDVYAFPAYVGLYVFASRPFQPSSMPNAFENRRYQALFGAAVVALAVSFAYHTLAAHEADPGVNRQETQALLRPVLEDPRCKASSSDIRIAMTYYNGLTDHNLVNGLLLDLDQPAVQADRPAGRKVERPGRCVVNVLLKTYMVGPEFWGGIDSAVNDRMVSALPRSADYAVVLAPDSSADAGAHTPAKYYPQWADLTRRLLASGCWTPVGTVRMISPWEQAMLLRRSCG